MRALILFFLVLSSCQQPNMGKQVARLNIYSDPRTLDPRLVDETVGQNVSLLLFEGLTRMGPLGKAELALAQSVTISDDGKVYRFELRKSYWATGERLTAHDFVRTWRSSLRPDFPSPLAYLLYPILHARAIKQGILHPSKLGVRAIDPSTLVIELEQPTPHLLQLLSTPPYYPVPIRMHPIPLGNGPFCVSHWAPDHQLLLKRNPTYWDHSQVQLDGMELMIIPHENTALLMFEKGELDYIGLPFFAIPMDALPSLQDRYGLHFTDLAAMYWYKLNTTRSPLNNRKIRLALSMSIDRASLAHHIAADLHTPASGALPDCLRKGNSSLISHQEEAEATTLFHEGLNELGLNLSTLDPIELCLNQGEDHLKIATSIARMWESSLGIHVQLRVLEWHEHLSRMRMFHYDIGRLGWQAHYLDPLDILAPFANSPLLGGPNETGWDDPHFRQILEQSYEEVNEEQRLQLLQQAEAILVAQMPVIPIFSLRMTSCYNPRLQGILFSPMGTVDFKKVSFQGLTD